MSFTVPPEFSALAHRLADAARPIVRRYYRQDNWTMQDKDDRSIVTIADQQIEEHWRDIISQARPDDAVWGEEYGRHNPDAEWTWIFDPIDGTNAFTLGRPTFGCMIGLHHKAHGFVLGCVDQPITELRWFGAQGAGAQLNGAALRTKALSSLRQARVVITNPMRLTPELQALQQHLMQEAAFVNYGGDCANFVGIADNSLHIGFETRQKIYDFAAAIPIIRESGGCITNADGSDIAPHEGVYAVLSAATPALHAQMLAFLRGAA